MRWRGGIYDDGGVHDDTDEQLGCFDICSGIRQEVARGLR